MDWLIDALVDSLKLIPFLFLAYVLIEFIETVVSKKINNNNFFKGKFAPLVGAGFGMVPQCGFSVVATDLYSQKKITAGTLIAIFIATSDEAIPVLLSNLTSANAVYTLLSLLASKLLLGILFGYIVDLSIKLISKKQLQKAQNCALTANSDALDHDESLEGTSCEHHEHSHDQVKGNIALDSTLKTTTVHKGCCGHDIEEDHVHPAKQYVLHPLVHTLKVFVYILLVNIIFSACIHYLGEDKILEFLLASKYFAPLLACIIGLIPNCASSVILTNLLIIGGLSFSACLAGLIVNAGIAYLVLFKQNKNIKANLLIVFAMFLIGLVSGYAFMLCGV